MPEFRLHEVKEAFPDLQKLQSLKKGGQKAVYRAEDKEYGTVVLKLVSVDTLGDDEEKEIALKRIQREIDLSHRNIANIPIIHSVAFKQVGDGLALYLVEEFLQGETLQEVLDKYKKLPIKDAIKLFETLLTVDCVLEREKIVHRDIKPNNIMVTPEQQYRLFDFGIARDLNEESITKTNARYGPHTLGYAPIEQIRNHKKEEDIRTDLWAIGVVVYQAITGRHPFKAANDDPFAIIKKIDQGAFKELTIPGDTSEEMAQLISTLMERNFYDRPNSAQQALDWFNELLPSMAIS